MVTRLFLYECQGKLRFGECIARGVDESQGGEAPGAGIVDADSWGGFDAGSVPRIIDDEELAAGQIKAVVSAGDLKGAGEFTGSGEVGGPAVEGFGGADEHRLRVAGYGGDDVEHFVHAVDEVDVGVPAPTEHDFGARGAAFGGVAGEIMGADVGFGFDDAGTA